MSNQEMQFADPDWKPSQQLNPKNDQQEQEAYTPQPVNNEDRQQNKWNSAPYAAPQQQEGYTGLHPYNGTVPGQMQSGMYRQRVYGRRRGRGMWFWIVLAFIVFSLISGGSHFSRGFDTGYGPSVKPGPVYQGPVIGQANKFIVNGTANISITNPNGNITVTEDPSDTNSVIIQTVTNNGPFGNPNGIQPTTNQQGNTITAKVQEDQGPVELNITVPENTNVDLTAGGSIKFNGTFDASGTNQFKTTNGDISITVPSSSAFHVDASTSSGSINSDFPNLKIQDSATGGQSVNATVGGNVKGQVPNVIIHSDSGDITLNSK